MADSEQTIETTVCKHCKTEIHPNNGQYPNRGDWLDSVDWSVCDWTYSKHEPLQEIKNV